MAGWRLSERDVGLPPARRARGRRCPARCAARPCGPRLLAGARVTRVRAGRREGTGAGPGQDPARRRDRDGAGRRRRRGRAARHAGRLRRPPWAPALPPRAGGDLDRAVARTEIAAALAGWTVHPQRGGDFGARLASAHRRCRGPVVPGRHGHPAAHARTCCSPRPPLDGHDAVLGPAEDGGWWVLALRDPAGRRCFVTCRMSTPTTVRRHPGGPHRSRPGRGHHRDAARRRQVADAEVVARLVPGSSFAEAWGLVSA